MDNLYKVCEFGLSDNALTIYRILSITNIDVIISQNLTLTKFIVIFTFHVADVKSRRSVIAGTLATIPITSGVSVFTKLFMFRLQVACCRCWIFKLVVVRTNKFKGKSSIIRRWQTHQHSENTNDNNHFMSHQRQILYFGPRKQCLQWNKLADETSESIYVKMYLISDYLHPISSLVKTYTIMYWQNYYFRRQISVMKLFDKDVTI